MNALETLLRPVTAMINRQIRSKTPARDLCSELQDRAFAIRVRDTSLAMVIVADSGELVLTNDYRGEPDTAVSGSLLSLARLLGPSGETAIRDGSVELSGNADVAQKFQNLLRFGRPDIEEELSAVIGDVLAHSIGEAARKTQAWGARARATMMQNVSEYLQEENRVVPSRYETEHLARAVESLRDDVARLEARLKQIDEHRNH